METLGAAQLAKEIPAQRAVAAIVPREEITAVLGDPEGSPELSLRIVEESDQESTIAMTWSRDDLARLLEGATGENVVLTFDREELSQAIGDVEAHGLKDRALVFAVVAAGALGSGAAIANAMPTTDDGGPVVASTAQVAPVADSMTDASSAGGYSVVAPSTVATGSMVTDASSAAGYSAVEPSTEAAGSMVTDASSAAGYTSPASDQGAAAASAGVTDASSAGGYTAPAADTGGLSGAMMTDASSSGGYGTVEATGSSGQVFGISESDVTGGLVAAGAILLTITGATFASRHTRPARPA